LKTVSSSRVSSRTAKCMRSSRENSSTVAPPGLNSGLRKGAPACGASPLYLRISCAARGVSRVGDSEWVQSNGRSMLLAHL
jgi:hypothetical protein